VKGKVKNMPTTATPRKRTVTNKSALIAMPTPALPADEIAQRAHEIFLARGGEHGHDLEDWLQAESELLSQRIVRRRARPGVAHA